MFPPRRPLVQTVNGAGAPGFAQIVCKESPTAARKKKKGDSGDTPGSYSDCQRRGRV
ncbi:MAG: hypothetical protein J2P37_12475 [Ktedonobacteraceae bacterium]|nr:hypothetical protein [Ktedonobacteraceae bacterium]MBO0790376.1 hypothetical protein [Ktedonobacteraceae bacterium]